MTNASDTVGHAVHHAAKAVGAEDDPKTAHSHFDNLRAFAEYSDKTSAAGKHRKAKGITNYDYARLRNQHNLFNAVWTAGTHILRTESQRALREAVH